ncbi:hypothetical protein Ct61P_15196 [Colletotrichum tofieldiae]|nr:hypothetical protein Ct61P_15196 [Colletotrichum tofieldiae]
MERTNGSGSTGNPLCALRSRRLPGFHRQLESAYHELESPEAALIVRIDLQLSKAKRLALLTSEAESEKAPPTSWKKDSKHLRSHSGKSAVNEAAEGVGGEQQGDSVDTIDHADDGAENENDGKNNEGENEGATNSDVDAVSKLIDSLRVTSGNISRNIQITSSGSRVPQPARSVRPASSAKIEGPGAAVYAPRSDHLSRQDQWHPERYSETRALTDDFCKAQEDFKALAKTWYGCGAQFEKAGAVFRAWAAAKRVS